MAVVTINQFLDIYKQETDDFQKKVKRIIFNICSDVQLNAIRNVDRLLNKTKNLTASKAGSRGNLRNSIKLKGDTRGIPFVEAGEGLSYAAIHEFGGLIRPVEKEWLTIPAIPENYGKTAKEVGQGVQLLFHMVNPQLAYLFEPFPNKQIRIHFWLKKEVNMPATHYLGLAGESVMSNQKKYVSEILGNDSVWRVS